MLASWSGSGTLTAGLSLTWSLTTSTSTSAIVEVWLTEPHSCLALLVVITSPAPDSVIQKWPGPEPKISSEAKVAPPSNAARESRRHIKNCQFTFEDNRGHLWNNFLKFNQCENCENFGSAYQTDFLFMLSNPHYVWCCQQFCIFWMCGYRVWKDPIPYIGCERCGYRVWKV